MEEWEKRGEKKKSWKIRKLAKEKGERNCSAVF
jgi:hypothetical protein